MRCRSPSAASDGSRGFAADAGAAARRAQRLDRRENDGRPIFDLSQKRREIRPALATRQFERLRRGPQNIGAEVPGGSGNRMRVPGGGGAVARGDGSAQGIEHRTTALGEPHSIRSSVAD